MGEVTRFIGWQIEKFLRATGYVKTEWLRIEQQKSWQNFFDIHKAEQLSALEISPGHSSLWKERGFGNYQAVQFPEFDICRESLSEKFDVIIADNVFEHIPDAVQAIKNTRAMLKDGGYFLMATPFLFRVHGRPFDFIRWTRDGLMILLQQGGFSEAEIEVHSWGNKACVKANLDRIVPYGWSKDMENDDEFPAMVWAFARKNFNQL